MSVIPNSGPFELSGGEVAILMIHGFTGSPVSVRPWAEALNKAGFTVVVPLLPGHGGTWEQMNQTRWEDWFDEVERSFTKLRERYRRVFVAGFSMGGALTLRLAAQRGRDIEGLILVNPSIYDNRPVMRLVPLLKYIVPSIGGRGTDVAAPNPPKHSYGRTPLKALHSLQKLWRTVQRDLPVIQSPLMIGYSVNDHVVDPLNSEFVIKSVASIDIREVIFERSFHNVALDYDADILAMESIAFIKDVLSGDLQQDENDLIDAEFDSIVAGLDLDTAAPTSYLDALGQIEDAERYLGDNKPLPILTPVQRGALMGVTIGPAYAAITSFTSFDPFGLSFWPGLIALVAGVFLFFWQMKPESDEDDGVAL